MFVGFDFFYFEFDVIFDLVFGEYVVCQQEVYVCLQFFYCFVQGVIDSWDVSQFFCRQIVQVFVVRWVWIDFVFDVVDVGYQQSCEVEVWVCGWIREMCFDVFGFWRFSLRNMNIVRMVMCRVGVQNRCFEVWDQMFVVVGGWVGEGVQCFCVFQDIIDEVQSFLGQVCVLVISK